MCIYEDCCNECGGHGCDSVRQPSDTLKWAEMMWMLKSPNKIDGYLGEAGNSSYRLRSQCRALRVEDQVIVTAGVKSHIISADTIVKGFGDDKDGKTLRDLLVEDVVYAYTLEPFEIVSQRLIAKGCEHLI